MRKEDFQFMVEGMVSDLIQLLIERRGLTMTEAFDLDFNSITTENKEIDIVCKSKTYENLLNPETMLYFQSPGYVYSYLEDELK